MKRCACGAAYDAAGWAALPFVGVQVVPADDAEPELRIELRNCPCHGAQIPSTLAVEITNS